jgi:hypothetical protein
MKCKAALGREVFETFYFPPLRLFSFFFHFFSLVERNGLKMNQIFLSFPSCTNVFFFCRHKFNEENIKKFCMDPLFTLNQLDCFTVFYTTTALDGGMCVRAI